MVKRAVKHRYLYEARNMADSPVNKELDALKAQYDVDAQRAKNYFAEITAIKAASITPPAGKDGTYTIKAGTAGTLLEQARIPLIALLDEFAANLSALSPPPQIFLTEDQLAHAYKSAQAFELIGTQIAELEKARQETKGAAPRAGDAIAPPRMMIAPLVAAAGGIGMALDAVNGLGKLFRTNVGAEVFSTDEDATEILAVLLETQEPSIVTASTRPDATFDKQADELCQALRALAEKVQEAKSAIEEIDKRAAAGVPPDSSAAVNRLRTELTLAQSLLDSLLPSVKPDAFWQQVAGQQLSMQLRDKNRLVVKLKAQAVMITVSRWWRGDRLYALGELRATYRVFDQDGKTLHQGVTVRTSNPDRILIDDSAVEPLKDDWPKALKTIGGKS